MGLDLRVRIMVRVSVEWFNVEVYGKGKVLGLRVKKVFNNHFNPLRWGTSYTEEVVTYFAEVCNSLDMFFKLYFLRFMLNFL